jgi:hypothetical protein
MTETDPIIAIIGISLILIPIIWFIRWSYKDQPQPKLDFGPDKKDGWIYYVWNWKTYAFYTLLIVFSVLGFIEQGIAGVFYVACTLYGLKLLGKLF